MSKTRRTLVALAVVLASSVSWAQDSRADREAAVDRYLAAVPMQSLMDDMMSNMSRSLPEAQRERFLTDMRRVLRVDVLQALSRDAMVKIFTAAELGALADFYASPVGKSAMAKMGPYMGELMPQLMAEVQRAVQQLQQQPR